MRRASTTVRVTSVAPPDRMVGFNATEVAKNILADARNDTAEINEANKLDGNDCVFDLNTMIDHRLEDAESQAHRIGDGPDPLWLEGVAIAMYAAVEKEVHRLQKLPRDEMQDER
jgi:hypothetical protein